MKSPNSEMFRIVRFAIRYPGWHSYAPDVARQVKRAAALGLVEDSPETKQFRLPLSAWEERVSV